MTPVNINDMLQKRVLSTSIIDLDLGMENTCLIYNKPINNLKCVKINLPNDIINSIK
jgi:hypothetical protein